MRQKEPMDEAIENARQELRRADHLLYVSLKYSRTVDVIKNVLNRLLLCLEESLNTLLQKKVLEKKLETVPDIPRLKIELVRRLYAEDPFIIELTDFFTFLRSLQKCSYDSVREFRRHVTMIAHLPEGDVNVDIDKVGGFYQRTTWYLTHVHGVCGQDEQRIRSKHV